MPTATQVPASQLSAPQAYALAQHNAPSKNWYQRCEEFVRKALGLPGGAGSAAIAEQQAVAHNALHSGIPPADVPVFFDTGKPDEHVALSAGGGYVWSTDIEAHGKVDLVPISEIQQRWGATYLGWGSYLNGVNLTPGADSAGAGARVEQIGLSDIPGDVGQAGKDLLHGRVDKIPGDLANTGKDALSPLTDTAGAAAGLVAKGFGAVFDPLFEDFRDFAVKGAFALLGVGLVGAGLYQAFKPQIKAARGAAQQGAAIAALA